MKVFIPMAGRGTRLKPFTLKTPKPLINVAGRPIVSHLISQIALSINTNIEEIIYIVGDECYFDDKIIKLLIWYFYIISISILYYFYIIYISLICFFPTAFM